MSVKTQKETKAEVAKTEGKTNGKSNGKHAEATKDAEAPKLTASSKKAEKAAETEAAKATRKLNAESYKEWKFTEMPRCQEEEKFETPQTTEPVREKRESDTYWNTRELNYKLTGRWFRTPQKNVNYIIQFLNKKLPAERKILKQSVVCKGTENLRFFAANLEKDGYIAANSHKPIDPQKFLASFGL